MSHVSTPLARTLGGAALLSAATAWAATSLPPTDAPRLHVLMPLALAALFSLGWVLASRSAPLVEPLQVTAPPRETIPGKLGTVRRDRGFFLAAFLVVWAPCAGASSAAGKGVDPSLFNLYVAVSWLFGAVFSLFVLALLKSQLGPAQRVLREDAAAGGVHAIRVRFRTPVKESYRYPTRNGSGQTATTSAYYVELARENETDSRRPIRLQAMPGHNLRITVGDKHLAQAAAQLAGHSGWLCWPTRWRNIARTSEERTVSAAFVSDSGHVVWGVTPQDDYAGYLRDGAAPLCRTDTALAVEPLPRPSRYFPKVHASHLRVAAVGALLAVPFLLGAVPHWAGMLLGVASGAVGLFAGMTMDGVGVDQEPWTVRETSHPSLR